MDGARDPPRNRRAPPPTQACQACSRLIQHSLGLVCPPPVAAFCPRCACTLTSNAVVERPRTAASLLFSLVENPARRIVL